jgi:hypothetical protein
MYDRETRESGEIEWSYRKKEIFIAKTAFC